MIDSKRIVSTKYPKMSVALITAPSNPEQIIAHNYLECIEDKKINSPTEIPLDEAKCITDWVIKGGHTPALESIYLGFNIRGISKVVSHQIVRHRIGVSIGQRTQRANSKEYLGKIADNNHYILPPSILKLRNTQVKWFMEQAQDLYNELLRKGISEDEARYIIPQASETSMDFNIILKSLIGTASTRLCYLMQGEMVEVFRLIKIAVVDWNEDIGNLLKPICEITGKCNRNENNPTEEHPLGVCKNTVSEKILCRLPDDTFDLTKYSKDVDK